MPAAGFSAVQGSAVSRVLADDPEAEIRYAARRARLNRRQLGRWTARTDEPGSVSGQNRQEVDQGLVDLTFVKALRRDVRAPSTPGLACVL
jgi:hypothetical protein